MKERVRQAFRTISGGYSPDRVVADPELNRQFLDYCRRLGLAENARVLNTCLLNARKAGLLKGLPRARRTTFRDVDEYRHASEVAVRHLERRHNTTLDHIICDPDLVAEFDELAASITPGFDPLRYRWAALNLRKSKGLRPEILAHVVQPQAVRLGNVNDIDMDALPTAQGLYLFYSRSNALYVGETANLRIRIAKHLDHSDNKGLARWLWDHGSDDVYLEIQMLTKETSQKIRRALESELISSRHPLFNVKRR